MRKINSLQEIFLVKLFFIMTIVINSIFILYHYYDIMFKTKNQFFIWVSNFILRKNIHCQELLLNISYSLNVEKYLDGIQLQSQWIFSPLKIHQKMSQIIFFLFKISFSKSENILLFRNILNELLFNVSLVQLSPMIYFI